MNFMSMMSDLFKWESNPFSFRILPDLFVGHGKEINNIIVLKQEQNSIEKRIVDVSGEPFLVEKDTLQIALGRLPEWITLSIEDRAKKIADLDNEYRIQEQRKVSLEQEIPSVIDLLEKVVILLT